MRFRIISIFILISISGFSQITKIREAKISPNGDQIAMICYLNNIEDVFLYNFDKDRLIRITNSSELNNGLQYKTSLNWIDNNQLLFLSKQTGLVQQYILNLKENTIASNGESVSNEYFLEYSNVTQESFYIIALNNREPAVYKRKLNDNNQTRISKQNLNFTFASISYDQRFLTYKEMPIGKSYIYSIIENKHLKTNLPKNNTWITSWSPNSKFFLYKHSFFTSDNIPKYSLYIYDLEKNTSSLIVDKAEMINNAIWSPCENLIGYSLLDKFVLIDRETGLTKDYEISGTPVDWTLDCKSVLFIREDKLVLLNIDNKEIKNIIKVE